MDTIRMSEPADEVTDDRFRSAHINSHLRWVTESMRVNKSGKKMRLTGKDGPEWDFILDPYATVRGEIIELVSGNCLAYEVQDLDEKYVYGMLIDHPFSFEYLAPAERCRRLLHSEYTVRAGLSPHYSSFFGMR